MILKKQDDWYKNPDFWRLYRPLMFDPDRMADTAKETEGIIRLAGVGPGADVLDLCCGEGRHAVHFARRGMKVTGVDTNESYLETGRDEIRRQGLDVRFVKADVRDFVEASSYDFAMNFFTSFGYFENQEDDLLFCRNVCESLRPGGGFLVDTVGKETVALRFKPSEWFQRDGFLIMLEYRITDGWTHIENRWLFTKDDHENPGVIHEAVFRHRLYSAVEMALLLNEAGFSEVRFYGALDGRPYDHKAERMLAVAVK